MIFSAQQLFSDDQIITADADSKNVIELGLPGVPYGAISPLNQDVGKGAKIPILVQVTETFNNIDDLTISVATGATETLGTIIVSEVILIADLIIGKQFVIDVLPNEITERYLGIQYITNGASAPTVGRITAGITMGNQTNLTGA